MCSASVPGCSDPAQCRLLAGPDRDAQQARRTEGQHHYRPQARPALLPDAQDQKSFADIGQDAYDRLYIQRRIKGLAMAAEQLGLRLVLANA